jgi:hypothetical protein
MTNSPRKRPTKLNLRPLVIEGFALDQEKSVLQGAARPLNVAGFIGPKDKARHFLRGDRD